MRTVAVILLLGACAKPALAQTTPQLSADAASDTVALYFFTDVAGNRHQPEYDTIPIRIGGFLIAPALQVTAGYDSNPINRSDTADLDAGIIGALPTLTASYGDRLPAALVHQIGLLHINPRLARRWDDQIDINPQISGGSDWDGNSVNFTASGRFYRDRRLPRENRTEWHADLIGVIALGEKDNITLSADADRLAEVPGSNGTAVLDYYGFGPSLHTSPVATATANLSFGRVLGQARIAVSRDYYDNLDLHTADLLDTAGLAKTRLPATIALSQAFRERQTVQANANMTYNLTSETQFFVQTSYHFVKQLHPDLDPQTGAVIAPFDSNTIGFLLGIAKSFDRLIVVQLGGGWQYHSYLDPFYQSGGRLNLQGAADWYPTPLISFRGVVGQTYTGSAVPGVSDIAVRSLTLRADYEFRPNIELSTVWSSEWDHFPSGAGTTAAQNPAGSTIVMQSNDFEIDYKPNRLLEIGLKCGIHRRLSRDTYALGRFSAWRAGLTLTARL